METDVDESSSSVISLSNHLRQRENAEIFTNLGESAIVISMTDEREKRSKKEAFRAAIDEHVAEHYIAEREILHRHNAELHEIVQSYQRTEEDRAHIHKEALRQAESRVSEIKISSEALMATIKDRESKIREIAKILLERASKSQQARVLKILAGISGSSEPVEVQP